MARVVSFFSERLSRGSITKATRGMCSSSRNAAPLKVTRRVLCGNSEADANGAMPQFHEMAMTGRELDSIGKLSANKGSGTYGQWPISQFWRQSCGTYLNCLCKSND